VEEGAAAHHPAAAVEEGVAVEEEAAAHHPAAAVEEGAAAA
jgi:hypothetical protein